MIRDDAIMISLEERYENLKKTIQECGSYLLTESDDTIKYNLFEEFSIDVISFLHEDTLNLFLDEGSIGNIKGKWCYKEKPILGETYFFELNIDEFERNEITILSDEQFSPSVCFRDECVKFKGICEEIDDVYVIRFAIDWIEMISIENDDFKIKKGDAISFSLNYDRIGIYPYYVE